MPFKLILFIFLLIPFAVVAQETPSVPQATSAIEQPIPATTQTDETQRIALAEKMHDIWPVRTKVEDALDIAAQSFPEDQRDKFKSGMRKAIKYDQLEEESIAAMAKLFTVAELQKMVDFYGSPEGKSVSAKTDDYMKALEPVMTKMLDQALIEVRTGQ